ncbi:MAG: phosphohydrolase, partial [Bacillota bacterium]|nr:phosphohydrolase [Bacillota bacterium]
NRGQIESCVEMGLELREFLELALEAMQNIALELGL